MLLSVTGIAICMHIMHPVVTGYFSVKRQQHTISWMARVCGFEQYSTWELEVDVCAEACITGTQVDKQ